MTHTNVRNDELPEDLQHIAAKIDHLAHMERETCPNAVIEHAAAIQLSDTKHLTGLLDTLATTERSTLSSNRITQIISATAASVRTSQDQAHADLLAASEQAERDTALEERVFTASRHIIAKAQPTAHTPRFQFSAGRSAHAEKKVHSHPLTRSTWRSAGLLAASIAILAGGATWLALLDRGETNPARSPGTTVAVIQRVDDDMDALENLLDFTLSTASPQEHPFSLEEETLHGTSDETNGLDLLDELMELEGMS